MPELNEATLDVLRMPERQKYADLLSDVLCVCAKEHRRSFSQVSYREHHICEAASQIDLQNQGAICKNVSCSRESMVESIDHAPSEKDTFKKAYHEKWPFVTVDKKSDTCVNSEVCCSLVK